MLGFGVRTHKDSVADLLGLWLHVAILYPSAQGMNARGMLPQKPLCPDLERNQCRDRWICDRYFAGNCHRPGR
jgi:hypothetical protein